MNVSEISQAILTASLTAEDIASLTSIIKYKRDQLSVTNKHSFRIGQVVRVHTSTEQFDGVIQKINKKKAIIGAADGNYNVPLSLLIAA
jgi:hypothetical protein